MPPRIRRRITSARRDEIEKEQHQLSQVINRPFETVAGLPISYNKPPEGHYEDVLKQPLTVKDLAVLYTSLLRSRHNYVFCTPMFKLYWVKQSSYAKKLADLEKEKAKNDSIRLPVPRKTTNLSNAYTASSTKGDFERFPVLPNDVSARDAMVKLCDSSLTLGPHSFEIRIFILKDGRPEKLPKKRDPEYKLKQAYGQNYTPGVPIARPLGAVPTYSPTSGPGGILEGSKTTEMSPNQSKVSETTSKADNKADNSSETKSSASKAKADAKKPLSKAVSAKKDTEITPETSSENTKSPKKVPKTPLKSPEVSSGSESNDPITSKAPAPAADMQSIENTIMISNLNSIAREDASLNSLMKIVALGTASSNQIIEFKTYIEKAKAMGPQPHHAYLFDKSAAAQKYFLEKLKYAMRDSQMGFKEKKIPKLRLPRDQKLTAFQERYLDNATLLFEFVENPNVRFLLPQDSICEVMESSDPIVEDEDDEDPTEYKDILLSTLWVHNVAEIEKYEEKLAEYNRLVKEREEKNRLEEEEIKKKQEAKNTEGAAEESESKQPVSENGATEKQAGGEVDENEVAGAAPAEADIANEAGGTDTTSTSGQADGSDAAVKIEVEEINARPGSSRKTRNKKKGRPPPRAPSIRKLERPVEPEIKFTAFSFTIHNIPARYVPIVMNSMKPVEEVQKRMEHIIQNGTRLNSFYLWYQVDGKLDEKLAEGLRNGLVQEEKTMPGIAPALAISKEPKKRKIKDKTIVRPKKLKVEDVPGQATGIGPSLGSSVPVGGNGSGLSVGAGTPK